MALPNVTKHLKNYVLIATFYDLLDNNKRDKSESNSEYVVCLDTAMKSFTCVSCT